VDFGGCVLWGDDGFLLRATVRGRLMGPRKSLGNAVVVGDFVGYQVVERTIRPGAMPESAFEEAVVVDVERRRNVFSRRAAGRVPAEQVMAANLDQVIVVASYADPPFRHGFADRVLAQAERAGIAARLVLNKIDLADDREGSARAILEAYAAVGYATHAVCARAGEGVSELAGACDGRRSLFVGHSGVGKSTLLNTLVPGLDLLVGQVNQKTGKGRHTTTAACLVRPAPGFELIDTPGMRAFGLWGISPRDLEEAYRELRPHRGACRFGDCAHVQEPGCAVRAAVEAGEIPKARYESFLKLRDELVREVAAGATRLKGTP